MIRSPNALADRATALVLALALALTGCGPPAPDTRTIYYVSIGDSYATGDGPNGQSLDGFTHLTESALQRDDAGWRLVNFGCSGATAQQMAHQPGCDAGARAEGGPEYPDVPQVDAAARFIAEHRDQVGLVTVVAGGNDVAPCIAEATSGEALACAGTATASAAAALEDMLGTLEGALDPGVPVIGVSYLNVFLAGERADIAGTVFDEEFDPILRQTYSRSGARFTDSPVGSSDDVCALSYWCSDHDVHPNRAGHQRIADQILGKLVDS